MSIHNPGFPLLSQIGANSFRIFLASHHLTRLLLCIAMFGQPDLMKIVDIPNQASIPTPKSTGRLYNKHTKNYSRDGTSRKAWSRLSTFRVIFRSEADEAASFDKIRGIPNV